MVTRKSNLIKRFEVLLAATQFSEQDIAAIYHHLRATSLEEFIRQIRTHQIFIDDHQIGSAVVTRPAEEKIDAPLGGDVAAQIERLLILDSGLQKSEAALLLTETIKKRHPKSPIVQFNSKDGFRRWLNILSYQIPLAEILHAAATVRNSRVHAKNDDWLDPDTPK